MSTMVGWRLVHDNRGGIHHYRRELGDGTLFSVSSPPSGGWWWGLFNGSTGRKLAGTAGSRKSALDTAAQAMCAADEYDRTRQESTS
jgi:hypothetical protein